MDNVDPAGFDALFRSVAPGRTGFLVISKSGGTLGTAFAQFIHCFDVFRNALGRSAAVRHFMSICEPGPRPLRYISERHGMTSWIIRSVWVVAFSAFSITGMLPAMIAGLDAEGFAREPGRFCSKRLAGQRRRIFRRWRGGHQYRAVARCRRHADGGDALS